MCVYIYIIITKHTVWETRVSVLRFESEKPRIPEYLSSQFFIWKRKQIQFFKRYVTNGTSYNWKLSDAFNAKYLFTSHKSKIEFHEAVKLQIEMHVYRLRNCWGWQKWYGFVLNIYYGLRAVHTSINSLMSITARSPRWIHN